MRCTKCGFENRSGVTFCEECGDTLEKRIQGGVCPKCGFENRLGVTFCEECGHALVESVPGDTCLVCGFENRPGVLFCEECGQSLKVKPRGMVCPQCGNANRPGISYCEECGASLVQALELEEPAKRKPSPRKRLRLAFVAMLLIGLGVATFIYFRPGVQVEERDFQKAISDLERTTFELVEENLGEWEGVVDPSSGVLSSIPIESGTGHFITYGSKYPPVQSEFNPHFIFGVDLTTGEVAYIEAP
jgi:Zn finger protein HypA/HybF involved in hydrogenase expression